MPRDTKVNGQTAMDENVIDDKVVEAALEEMQTAREVVGAARKVLKPKKAVADAAIERLELPVDGAVRVGRFRLSRKALSERHVDFDVAATDRVYISVVK